MCTHERSRITRATHCTHNRYVRHYRETRTVTLVPKVRPFRIIIRGYPVETTTARSQEFGILDAHIHHVKTLAHAPTNLSENVLHVCTRV